MAVIDENEVELNSIKYPIIGKVKPILSSNFAQKMVIGDFTKASNPEVDSWVIQDQRGGILAEEMDEARQADRAWWSTCNLGFLGHILLPPLATAVNTITRGYVGLNLELDDWTDSNLDNWTDAGTGTIAENTTAKYSGTSCLARGIAEGAYDGYVYQDFTNPEQWIGRSIVVSCWATMNVADALTTAYLTLYRNGAEVKSDSMTNSVTWTQLETTSYTVPSGTTALQIRLRGVNASGSDRRVYHDLVTITSATDLTISTFGTPRAFCNFNSQLYQAVDKVLLKLHTDGASWRRVNGTDFGANVTDLVSDGSYLYIYLGDAIKYQYMDTSETITENTDELNANLGIYWDSKLFKVNTSGTLYYTATSPANDSTDWTTGDTLPLTTGYLKSLFLYRDAAGNYVIYAGTRLGLWTYDFTNAKWIETEVSLPDHPTCGMGTVHWREKSYISAGLDVLAYQTGGAGTSITSMGLDRDDGLPQLRGGEIVKLINGYNEFFALVDSVYEGATSYSTVMAYDGRGWQCWWKTGTVNEAMHIGIVSSVVAHRLWFDCGTSVYYIPLQRNLRNPKKVSTFAYYTAGIHITPWFDANWVGQKLALQLKIFCKDVTANETVLVDYRIDHIEVDLTTGWNNLGTIVAAGNEVETTYTFGSSLGTNFKAIQFRFSLARDAGGSNPEYDSPDVQYAVLEYQKIIKPTWGWAFTIDCTKEYAGRTANQMLDAVVTAAELEVLTPFLYKDTTFYVQVKSVEGERLSGDGQKGTYNILVSKPV